MPPTCPVARRLAQACTLRGLLQFKEGTAVPLEEVEPAAKIVRRFVTVRRWHTKREAGRGCRAPA